MRIFVIGGTGFISGRLTQLLLDEGHHVTIFTRGRRRPSFEADERLEHVRGDRGGAGSLRKALEGRTFDAAYDMIAYDGGDSRAAVDALQGRVDRFIHCSTISVYMVSDDVRCPITEDQDNLPVMEPWSRNPFGMDYGIGKRACEAVLWKAHGDAFDVTSVRPTFVSGPEDKSARDYFWIQRIMDGEPLLVPGCGDHAFQQIYVDDAARAFADVLTTDASRGEAYNVVGEDIYSLNDYLKRVSALLGREVELVHIDQDRFDALSFSTHHRGDVFPFNTRRTAIFSLEKIKRDIGYRSTPFEEWMRKTIDWYLSAYDSNSLGYDRRPEELDVIESGG